MKMKTPLDFIQAYATAVRNANIEDYAELYEDKVRVFDRWDLWQVFGQNACREQAQQWFGSLNGEYVVVTFSEVELIENGNVAILSALVRYAGHSVDGTQLRFLDERITVGFRKDSSGHWLVVHQHTSAPIESNSLKSKMTIDYLK